VPYRHEIRVRYGEVDLQGVVFNAHYLAYCDDACDTWMRTVDGGLGNDGWDIMLKKADITWHGSAGLGDVLAIDVGVSRFGNSSFDVAFDGTVADRPVFTAIITYVAVRFGTTEPIAVPERFRDAADRAVLPAGGPVA
jgi:acyl-CoA thioester hydrolase